MNIRNIEEALSKNDSLYICGNRPSKIDNKALEKNNVFDSNYDNSTNNEDLESIDTNIEKNMEELRSYLSLVGISYNENIDLWKLLESHIRKQIDSQN